MRRDLNESKLATKSQTTKKNSIHSQNVGDHTDGPPEKSRQKSMKKNAKNG